MVRSTISELTDTTPRWSVQAVRAGEAAGCRLVWLLSSCVQPPAATQCGDPSGSTSCACDQAARLISGFHKGRGGWRVPLREKSGGRGAARL